MLEIGPYKIRLLNNINFLELCNVTYSKGFLLSATPSDVGMYEHRKTDVAICIAFTYYICH